MTQPRHAISIPSKGRYYTACGRDNCPLAGLDPLISITNAQGVVAKPALVPAAAKATAEKAWLELPRMVTMSRQPPTGANGCATARAADRCGHCRFCLTAEIKAHHRNLWEHAADLGTRVHAQAAAHVTGEPLTYDDEAEPYVDTYLRFLDDFHVDIDRDVAAAETTVYDTQHGYAGTGDLWISLPLTPTGRPSKRRLLWLVDLKTSQTKPAGVVYPDQILQLAGLRYAPKAILADDTSIDVPVFAGTALLNLRRDTYALIPVPADETAYAAFLNAVGLQHFMQNNVDTKTWNPAPAPAAVAAEPTRKAS